MSAADFKKFGKMIAENETVRNKAKAIGMTDINGQVAYAKTLGLEFTAEDISELVKETGVSDELNEDQLEQIAGGVVTTTFAIVGAVAGAVGAAAGAASIGVAVGSESSKNW